MKFEVTILGSGAALPTAQRNPTAQYVECCDRHILIDCGEGTQNQLRRRKIKLQKITIILISHLHGDHFFGLVGLLSSMHLLGRTKGITVFGPDGLEQIIRSQLEIGGAKLDFEITFEPLFGNESKLIFEDKLIQIHTFPLKHRIPTNGFRIQEKVKVYSILGEVFRDSKLSLTAIPFFKHGEDFEDENGVLHSFIDFTHPKKPIRSYAYCSDTMYWEAIIPHIENVDLLYHEATFLERMKERAKSTHHSTAKQAATIALKANVKKLILGHLSARYDSGEEHLKEAKTVFENTEVVEDGNIYPIYY